MAEKRMFSRVITESDAFQDMPLSTQALYFHLGMCADDDGFVNSPRKIQRMIGASDDDMKILIGKRFILLFESGIVVIKHWRINNTIRCDRYHETTYLEEKRALYIDEKGAYTDDATKGIKSLDTKCIQDGYQMDTNGIPNGYQMDTENRIDKNRLDKNRIEESDIYTCVCDILGKDLSNADMQILRAWEKEYKEVEILEALREAISNNAKYPISYTDKLLKEKNKPTGSDWLDNFNKEMRGKGL